MKGCDVVWMEKIMKQKVQSIEKEVGLEKK